MMEDPTTENPMLEDPTKENPNSPQPSPAPPGQLTPLHINKNTSSDILHALNQGWHDMRKAPLYSLSFGLVYAGFGWFILFLMWGINYGAYAYPLATGFALIAPMAAGGCYEISRALEKNQPLTFQTLYRAMFGPKGQAVTIMAVVTTFSYIIWVDIAAAVYVAFFGMRMMTLGEVLTAIVTTPSGLMFFLIGNSLGALIAMAVFSIMALSLPLIYDRQVDFVTGIITSVKTVQLNQKPMWVWCLIIGLFFSLSFASLFVGLIVSFPLLGHTTWHIYRYCIPP